MMPLHLKWADDMTVTDRGQVKLPIGAGMGRQVTVAYPATSGGYTPGDVYELFLNDQSLPVQWSFHKGGAAQATLTTTWEDWQELGPLRLPLNHVGSDGKFRLWFDDLKVTLTDGSAHAAGK